MKKEKNFQTSKKVVNLHQKVLCASNGLECEGICRATHLQNSRTGICIAAFNPPKSRFKRVEKWDPEKYLDELVEFKALQFEPSLLA